jgi:hypothetical protein
MKYDYDFYIKLLTAVLVLWFVIELVMISYFTFSKDPSITDADRSFYLNYMKELDRMIFGAISIPVLLYVIWVVMPLIYSATSLTSLFSSFTKMK